MDKFLVNFIFFIVLFVIVLLVDYFLIFKKKIKNKKKKNVEIMEFNYLIMKFNLNPNKIYYYLLALYCSFINAFIISFVVTAISMIDLHMSWQLLIGFVLLFGLIYSFYEILGRHLIRKGWGK